MKWILIPECVTYDEPETQITFESDARDAATLIYCYVKASELIRRVHVFAEESRFIFSRVDVLKNTHEFNSIMDHLGRGSF